MTMVKTPIEIDEEALRNSGRGGRHQTKKDTVNAALREVGQRLTRLTRLPDLARWRTRGTSTSSSAIPASAVTPALYLIDTSGLFRILQGQHGRHGSDQMTAGVIATCPARRA